MPVGLHGSQAGVSMETCFLGVLLLHCETWMHFIPYAFRSVVKSGEFQGKVHADANAVSDLEFWIAPNSRLSLVIPGVGRVTRPP